MSGYLLVLVLLLLSGLVAYAGDYVGRKAGKKKLSLFNLRPKYTSRIISVITGILIMVFTLIILSIFSENVRIALFGMEKLKGEMSDLQSSIESKEKELSEILKKYEDVKIDREKAIKELAIYQAKLKELEEDRKKLSQELSILQKEKEALLKDREKYQRSIYELSKKLSILEKEKETLEEEKLGLMDEIQFLNITISNLRTEGMIFRRGELILNFVTRGGLKDEEAQKEAKSLLSLVEGIAINRGAGSSDKGYIWIPETEWSKLLDAISSPGEKLIRVFSLANIFEDEPVLINLQIVPYKLIFKAGDVILLRVVDGSESIEKIEEKLLTILADVNKIAQEKGVLPDPISNTVGEISLEDFYNIVYRIKEENKKVILKVIVVEDTYNSGPLKIRLEF
ncbi:MAG TPA: DUF3084 domain-containing protein [Dictyoglomaceae bacterium]|nr:DUF3084 domain-containing protein [Dictyoglomaceae bacterium]HOL40079.1 DUF3084 domain-containing protein [Dictyoglomaceae bacterium]HPP16593.1 DUF3084 domain-containing protein [Dictyoglomaceae bacterium]HPU43174.1 DUF3084 domain-containing protein [Dictyoglomaceae bacterium]